LRQWYASRISPAIKIYHLLIGNKTTGQDKISG
jgi:hypothetical protein